jgi:predicted nucleic acid-binding protein
VILVDTSGLLANYDRTDQYHVAATRVLKQPQRRILSPFVLAELDYLVERIAGQDAELAVLDDVARGVYELQAFESAAVDAASNIVKRYADLHLGLTDASIVVLADRYACYDILTLDQRHFRAALGSGGQAFRILPFDI